MSLIHSHNEPSLRESSQLDYLRARLSQRARRVLRRAVQPRILRALSLRNIVSNEPVVGADGPVVSLTTYGPRWDCVFYAIESVGAGSLKPSRIVLWVDRSLHCNGLPDSLQRLVSRGLEVRGTNDLRSHTKYLPYVCSQPLDQPLVTIDDDVLYPQHWLQDLLLGWRRAPHAITCFRAHRIGLDHAGNFTPYRDWLPCKSVRPSALNFFTGVSGVLYPPAAQEALKRGGDEFLNCCPRADDVWLNLVALRNDIPARQVLPVPQEFYSVPGTKNSGLANTNVWGGGNDMQLAASYRDADRLALQNHLLRASS